MRTLTEHQINPANDMLKITVVDEPGSGGANHAYAIEGANGNADNQSITSMHAFIETAIALGSPVMPILFQNGPINEVGVNGLTHEALLAILCDRMRGFQAGPYASADNAEALKCMEKAMAALQRRTRARMARGVEGTHAI